MRFKSAWFITIFYIFIGCNEQDSSSEQYHAVSIAQFTISQEASPYLSNVYPAIVSSPDGKKLALTNYETPVNMVVINREGELINTLGTEGRGPNEILISIYFGFETNDYLTVYDYSLAAFKRFSIDNGEARAFVTPLNEGLGASSEHRLNGHCGNKWFIALRKFEAPKDGSGPIVGVFDDEFNILSEFGDYDPFFYGHQSVLRSPRLGVNCEKSILYTTHSKVPFIQVFDTEELSKITRIDHVPPSFMLSDTFHSRVFDMNVFQEFRQNEQSTSKIIAPGDQFLKLVFYNETPEAFETRNFTKRHYYVAIYDSNDYTFLGEIPLEGAVYGATSTGELIVVHNDDPENFEIEILKITENS